MMKLHYAGGVVVVSDGMCRAISEYASHLATAGAADTVAIPAFTEDSGIGITHVVIGPSSQIICTPIQWHEIDLDDADAIADMKAKTKLLGPSHAVPSAQEVSPDSFDDLA